MTDNKSEGTVFILADGAPTAEGMAKFGGTHQISVEKLREHLQSFVRNVASALGGVATEIGAYQLSEVEVEASFSADVGFVFVAKTGIEGSVKLHFVRTAGNTPRG